MNQKTIKNEICFEGLGVHFGIKSKVILKPSSQDTGIVFVNPKFPLNKIELGKIIPEVAMHASVIKHENLMISTVEHLMAAISSFGIDNLVIEVHGLEIPILDGSAAPFVYEIEKAGVLEQSINKTFLTPKEKISFEDKEGRSIEVLSAAFSDTSNSYDTNLYFEYFADFQHPLVGKDSLAGVLDSEYFSCQIAAARTFGFLEQLPFLRRHGLAKGTTLGNTVVIGEEEFINDKRFENEFVRHKLLDLFGDLALLGKNLAGSIKAKKTGHSFNRLIVQHFVEHPEKWTLI